MAMSMSTGRIPRSELFVYLTVYGDDTYGSVCYRANLAYPGPLASGVSLSGAAFDDQYQAIESLLRATRRNLVILFPPKPAPEVKPEVKSEVKA